MCHFDVPNPAYDRAATISSLRPGVELLWVNYAGMSLVSTKVVTTDDIWRNSGHLRSLGIISLPELGWDDESLCVVNNAENRKALVEWLKSFGHGSVGYRSAESIVWDHPDEFLNDEITLAKDATLERLSAH